MAIGDQLARVIPHAERLFVDEYVQDQISQGLTSLRQGTKRAKGRKAHEALTDRRLLTQLQDAGASLAEALRALNAPEPPKRHRLRRAVLVAGVSVAGAYAWQQRPADPVGS